MQLTGSFRKRQVQVKESTVRSYQNPRLAGQAFPMLFAEGKKKKERKKKSAGRKSWAGEGKLDQGGGGGTGSEKIQTTEERGLKMEWQTLSPLVGFRS